MAPFAWGGLPDTAQCEVDAVHRDSAVLRKRPAGGARTARVRGPELDESVAEGVDDAIIVGLGHASLDVVAHEGGATLHRARV